MKNNYSVRQSACTRKAASREATIVTAYRNLTGLWRIPPDRQYWTLCGPMAGPSGGLAPGCELLHMLDVGLIRSASQFYGVEKNRTDHAANVKAVSQMSEPPHLYRGEIHKVLATAQAEAWLRPAIVFLDGLHEPKRAARLLGSVLNPLNHVDGPIMVALNTVIDNALRGRRYSIEKLMNAIEADPWCRSRILEYGWLDYEGAVEYDGAGHGGVKMATIVLYLPFRKAKMAG